MGRNGTIFRSGPARLRWGTCAGVLAALTWSASANAAPIDLEVVPSAVAVSPTAESVTTVFATNSSDERFSVTRLEVLADGPSPPTVDVEPTESVMLAPGSTERWKLSVGIEEPFAEARKLTLVAEFKPTDAAGSAQAGIATATLDLRPDPTIESATVATLELQAALTTLRSGETGTAYLLVRNASQQDLEVGPIEAFGPAFVAFDGLEVETIIPPRRVGVIPVSVEADDRVDPGKHQLVFRVPARSGRTSVDLTVASAVDIGVTGESEVLTAIGIPSLLLVPGFLVLAMAALLWRIGWLKPVGHAGTFPLEPKTAEFWLIAVAASFLIVLGGEWALDIDLFGRYSLEELMVLWMVSALIGAAVYALIIGTWRAIRRRTDPSGKDDPVETIVKLGRRGLGTTLPRFEYSVEGGTRTLYLLQDPDLDRTKDWLAPAIEYKPVDGTFTPELEKRITDVIDSGGEPEALAATLRDGKEAGALEVRWAPAAQPITGPRAVEPKSRGVLKGPGPLVGEAVAE